LPPLIGVFLPKYIEGISAIRVLAFTIPFMFAHTPAVLVLLSTDKYFKTCYSLSFLTLGFNVLLNFLLIPKYGYMGASYVTVFSEAFSFVVFIFLLQRNAFKMDSLEVVIVNWNTTKLLEECLSSIKDNLNTKKLKFMLSDNAHQRWR